MNIVIAGGGAAGWLTALTLQKVFKNVPAKITLIESEVVGILGAGEGSVPLLTGFLFNSLELPVKEFIKETNSVFKLGISFENWNGDGKKYFHPFANREDRDLIKKMLSQNNSLINHNLCQNGYKGISPYAINKNEIWESILNHSYHFDAHLVANFLRKHALLRGVHRVEGKITSFETDSNNNIKKILLDNNQAINCSFVFDCTGFHRLLIGKHYNTEWVSYRDYLPVKAALPFQLPQDEHILPYTHSVAMKYGWMWKIPLQHRFGCGYVFDNNFITADQAKDEIEQLLGHKVEVPRVLNFEAGRYKKVCVNNCIGIGLSVGFTEPIEATSILISILLLSKTAELAVKIMYRNDQDAKEELNRYSEEINELIMPFLYAHYLTKRDDTPFWKEFKNNTKVPTIVQELLEYQKHSSIEDNPYIKANYIFGLVNWVWVLEGLEILNKQHYSSSQTNLITNHDNHTLVTVREFLNSFNKYSLT